MKGMKKLINKCIIYAGYHNLFNWMSDELYIKTMYKAKLCRNVELKSPQTLNDKIQWLKLNDHNEEYVNLVDKFEVRKFVEDKIGKEYLIPLLFEPLSCINDIDWDKLPKQFVIKCTHDSGGVVVCKDKDKLNKQFVLKKLEKSMNRNYYFCGREWPYKKIKPRIIVEKYMEDESSEELKDYKILCFNGNPINIMVCTGRNKGNLRYYFFDKNWNFLRYNKVDEFLEDDFTLPRPKDLEEMIRIAQMLSNGLDLVRVDLYQTKERVYFGEMTLYPDSGFDTDITYETDKLLGNLLDIKCIKGK